MNENAPNMVTEWIDPDDAPELTDAFFAEADEYMGNILIRRGQPPAGEERISTTFDTDVISAFRATGEGWQARMNDALRDWLQSHSPANMHLLG